MLIEIWPFTDAPKELRELSPHGGDEDYVARMSKETFDSGIFDIVVNQSNFGCCDISTHPVGEDIILIGAHA